MPHIIGCSPKCHASNTNKNKYKNNFNGAEAGEKIKSHKLNSLEAMYRP